MLLVDIIKINSEFSARWKEFIKNVYVYIIHGFHMAYMGFTERVVLLTLKIVGEGYKLWKEFPPKSKCLFTFIL